MDASILKRADLLRLLADAANKVPVHLGIDENFDGGTGLIRVAEPGNMSVMLRTPKTEIVTTPSAFDVDVGYGGNRSLEFEHD